MKAVRALFAIAGLTVLWAARAVALDPSLDISQYAHTAWTLKDGFSLGYIYAITQTPDGYLWLGTEFGLVRFDGIRAVPWQPPAGQHLPDKGVYRLLAARDGTLWIGSFAGLTTLSGGKLIPPAHLADQFVTSLFEDHQGTVWVGTEANATRGIPSRVCGMRAGSLQCYGDDNSFGHGVQALYEDRSGNLWASGETQVWRISPGPPTPYATIPNNVTALSQSDGGQLLLARYGGELMQLLGGRVQAYPIRSAAGANTLRDRQVNSNKLLRDGNGGLWIGTVERGLIHVHNRHTDVFTKSDGLSGDVVLALFEDREGNVWVATTSGLDRFRELPVSTISAKQGLSSDATSSVLAASDGTIWIAGHDGLTRWKNGQATIFRKSSGLPDDATQSLFQDERGRIWVSSAHGVAYFKDGRFVVVATANGQEVHSIAGDKAGNMWLSESKILLHFRDGRLVEQIPWSELRRIESASVLASGREKGELWLGFWQGGGVSSFKAGRLRESYTAANGLAEDAVQGLQIDQDGAVWVATVTGLSRIKDGSIARLTSRNGLPCDTVFWSIKDDDGLFWLYTGCGIVSINPTELEAWITDPKRRIETTLWDAADGVRLRALAATASGPRVSKSPDGKLWFLTGEGVQVIDPCHVVVNKLPPTVHIEQVLADHKTYWENLPGAVASTLRFPPRIRDLQIDYTALSLTAPEKVHFKYKLEGQDSDWREVVNDRRVQYSNLRPGNYTFRVVAANNSGVWNENGDTLQFFVTPAYYQTNWFQALCALAFFLFLWAAYQYRLRQLQHEFDVSLEVRVGERTRIARELHDTLLQSFQGVLPRFQAAIYKLPENAVDARKTLEAAVDQASQAITEGRDAVQGLRMSTVEKNDLGVAVRTIGEELAAGNGVSAKFDVIVEGQPHDLRPILRDEVYRIAAEALRNAFQHSQAGQIEVGIGYGEKEFTLHVRDNGSGIDRGVLGSHGREGRFGLHSMRERAELVGGKLTIWSELHSGTEIELIIPASKAYTKSPRRFWFSQKLSQKTDLKEKIKS